MECLLAKLKRDWDFKRFFIHVPATTEIYTLSLHDALPICLGLANSFADSSFADVLSSIGSSLFGPGFNLGGTKKGRSYAARSEEHTSELQSRENLVCRLLLEKKKGEREGDTQHDGDCGNAR